MIHKQCPWHSWQLCRTIAPPTFPSPQTQHIHRPPQPSLHLLHCQDKPLPYLACKQAVYGGMCVGMWTTNAAGLPCNEARTPPTHHLAANSAIVSCFLLPRNHCCPSPDCRGRSLVAERKSLRMARSSVAHVAATTAGLVYCWLVRPLRWRSLQMVCRNVTRKSSQSRCKRGGGHQTEGSPTMRTEG